MHTFRRNTASIFRTEVEMPVSAGIYLRLQKGNETVRRLRIALNRATARSGSNRLLTAKATYRSQGSPVVLVVDEVTHGKVFRRVLHFHPVIIIPQLLHIQSYIIWGTDSGPVCGRRSTQTVLGNFPHCSNFHHTLMPLNCVQFVILDPMYQFQVYFIFVIRNSTHRSGRHFTTALKISCNSVRRTPHFSHLLTVTNSCHGKWNTNKQFNAKGSK
jgi:hypothetical protein